MKKNLQETTVKDLDYFINKSFLKIEQTTPIINLLDILSKSHLYKAYVTDENNKLLGIIQAKKIAQEILRFSKNEKKFTEMMPVICFQLNYQKVEDFIEPAHQVKYQSSLEDVLNIMDMKHIREIAVVNEENEIEGVIEAKRILSYYLKNYRK